MRAVVRSSRMWSWRGASRTFGASGVKAVANGIVLLTERVGELYLVANGNSTMTRS